MVLPSKLHAGLRCVVNIAPFGRCVLIMNARKLRKKIPFFPQSLLYFHELSMCGRFYGCCCHSGQTKCVLMNAWKLRISMPLSKII